MLVPQLAFHRSGSDPQHVPLPERFDGDVRAARAILCAHCLSRISHEEARIEVAGAHAHRFTNPAGYRYDIVCLREAPGCIVDGEPTLEATWFPGFAWSYALCSTAAGGCGAHLGWRYDGAARFFGRIRGRLVIQIDQ